MPKEFLIKNKIKITYNDDNIFRYTFMPKSNIEIEDVKEMVRIGIELSQNIDKSANLVDTREMTFISNEARNFLASQNPPMLKGIALVINSKIHSGLANLYLKFSKPKVTTKIFTDIGEAESWLKAILK
jgi:hypothetical protein